MKKLYKLQLASLVILFVFLLNSITFAAWFDLTLDGKFSYDENRSSKSEDVGPTTTESLNLTYSIPFLSTAPLKGTVSSSSNTNVSGKTSTFKTTLVLGAPLFSSQFSRSEDNREDFSAGGTVNIRNDFSASFTPKEKYLPQLKYTFSEGDVDLSGASNSFDFKLSEHISSGSKISLDLSYSINKSVNVLNDVENQDERINFKVTSNPFNNIRFNFSRDFGFTDNTAASPEPITETIRTSYDLTLLPIKELNLAWKRSEDYSSANNDLKVTIGKTLGLTLKPLNKMDFKYDYGVNESESDTDVTFTNNTGQTLNLIIPLVMNIDLKYNYSLRKNADTNGYGTNSEDNGFVFAYRSPVIKGTALTMNFSFDTNSKQAVTDSDTREQTTQNWGLDGQAKFIKIVDMTFSHRDAVTKSNNYTDDQKSVNDSLGASLKYSIIQVINGSFDVKYNNRNSNASTQTSESSDRNISNRLDYKTGNLSLGFTSSYSENETDAVTSKKSLSPTVNYGLSKGKISFRYGITDRVDEDPITGDLTSSRDVNYDMGFNYNISSKSTMDVRYSARNHIDFEQGDSNDDNEKITFSLNFKF